MLDKKLISLNESKIYGIVITDEGKKSWKDGFIEKRLIKAVNKGHNTMQKLGKDLGKEINIALGQAKRKGWITIGKEITLTALGKTALKEEESDEERALKEAAGREVCFEDHVGKEDWTILLRLKKRGLVEEKEQSVSTPAASATSTRSFNKMRVPAGFSKLRAPRASS